MPSALLVLILGGSLLHNFMPISEHPWLILKLVFVIGLYGYHFFLHKIFKQQQNDIIAYSPMALRVINEISTIFLFAIVFLVILKSVMSMIYGIAALVGLILLLVVAIKIYKNIREKSA